MAGIKGIRGAYTPSQQNQNKSVNKGSFASVLGEKQTSKTGPAKSAAAPLDPQGVKDKMAQLLKGGAPTQQVVAQALKNNPLVAGLPAKMREDLIKQVSEQMDPLLNKA